MIMTKRGSVMWISDSISQSRIEIWNPVRPTTRRQPQDDQGSKESYPIDLDPVHLRTATILSQQATLQTGTDEVTGQGSLPRNHRMAGAYQLGTVPGRESPRRPGGDFRPHRRQTCWRESATWRRASQRRHTCKRKRRDHVFNWPKNLSGRNTIYYTICKMYMWTPTTIIPT